jgi:hypothetical protein
MLPRLRAHLTYANVEIDHPVVLEAPLPAHRERIMSRSARPVAISSCGRTRAASPVAAR